jgi:TorA maturation chaperone TorD
MSEASDTKAGAAPAEPEEQARANLYGLLGRLYYAAPDPNFLAEIARSEDGAPAEEGESGLVPAWHVLREASKGAFLPVLRQEYDILFVGVGRSEVTPYLSGYAEPASPERYLVRLREQLGRWGLGRRENVFEVEDHVSGICDVMRLLVEGGHSLDRQRYFFREFAYPGVLPFCVAVQNSPTASYYKAVAAFTWSFFEVERAALDMPESG